jgi:hypothetical protein
LFLLVLGTFLLLVVSPRSVSAQQPTGSGTRSAPPPAAAVPPAVEAPAPAPASKSALADFAWLVGRWRGAWGPRVAEQVWTAPRGGLMLGTFRLVEEEKTLVIELFSLVEKPEGISFYFRHFTPELVPWEKADASVLVFVSLDAKKIVFENPVNGEPKRVILTRVDADTYISRSEILPAQGEMQSIEITYHRQK